MKKTKVFSILMLVVFVSLTLVFIPGCKEKKEEQKVIKIGAILPLTGNLAWVGVGEKNGMELAKEKINKDGGILGNKIEIIYEDSQADPKLALSAANKLINADNIKFIISSTTACANVIIPIVEKANALEFALTIDPDTPSRSQNVYRVWVSDALQWKLIAEYINKNTIFKKIGTIRANNEYGLNVKSFFEKYLDRDVKIEVDEIHPIGEKDFKSIISNIKATPLDGIVIVGYPNDLITLVKQLKENNIKIQIFGNISFIYDFVKKELFELADGAIFTAPGFSIGEITPLGREFIDKYMEVFKTEPSWNEAYSYDNILIISEAIKKSNSTDTSKVKDALLTIKNFPAATGKITILENRDASTALYLLKYKNKKIEPVRY